MQAIVGRQCGVTLTLVKIRQEAGKWITQGRETGTMDLNGSVLYLWRQVGILMKTDLTNEELARRDGRFWWLSWADLLRVCKAYHKRPAGGAVQPCAAVMRLHSSFRCSPHKIVRQ